MKQTAVEWLVEQVNSDCLNSTFIRQDLIEQAKEMEKEQYLKMPNYDLDELAREMTDKEHSLTTQYSKGYEKGIVVGFQKALELLTFKSE